MLITDNLKSKSLWHSAKQISSISESFKHVQKITTSIDLKKKISSLVLQYLHPLFDDFRPNDIETSREQNQPYGGLSQVGQITLAREISLIAF